jgi:hypothetical protein
MIVPKKLNKEYLHQLFDYKDGELYWKIKRSNKTNVGDKAGSLGKSSSGIYYKVMIDYKSYNLHQIIFLYFFDYIPSYVDHIDKNTLNNKIENLREATCSQNMWNVGKIITNKSGYKNIHFEHNKWVVRFRVNGEKKYFGRYEDIKLANFVAIEARNLYHKNYARHE